MACDDWKLEQDAARQQWTTSNNLACDTTYTSEIGQCNAAHAQRLNRCNSIQCTSLTNCDAIQCTSYTNCNGYWATDPRRYACWTARGVCVAAKAVERAACWTARGVCVAAAAVARAACIAGSAVLLVACVAAAWVKSVACKAATWVADKAWAVGVAVGWGACKVYEIVIIPIVGWVNGVASKVIDWFRGAKPDQPDDIVPDFSGVTFDRRDEEGNIVPFLWGVSTSAYQVEGGIENNDWYHFTTSATIKRRVERVGNLGGTKLKIESAGRAVDHWNLAVFAEDLDRAKLLGMNAYRFSLEWSRIQPQKPVWADNYIKQRREGEDASERASSLRRQAQTAEGSGDTERARQLNAEASVEEERAEQAKRAAKSFENPPFDSTEFETEPVEHYKQMIKLMKDRGLQVILTLNHMSLPDWVLTPPIAHELTHLSAVEDDRFRNSLRGWENPVTVKAYENFVRFVVPHFKDFVSYWVTLNEPIGSSMAAGYMAGVWPPGFLGDGDRAKKVYFNFIDAHVRAYNLIKELAGSGAQVGLSHIVMYARRAPQTLLQKLIGDNEAAKNQWIYAFNHYFLDAITKGDFSENIWRKDTPEHKEEWTGKLDFIAPQYYRAVDIYHHVPTALKAPWFRGIFVADLRGRTDYLAKYLWNDMGWTIYPGGLYQILKNFHDRYNVPILITENGMAESEDRNRAAYTIAHLQQVLRAIKDGVNVIGYVHWSIVDNWELAFGYQDEARFGLFTVDRTADLAESNAASYPRHITEGAVGLQYVIANSRRITETNSREDPFNAPVARFGTINPQGLEVQPPTLMSGALWEGYFPGGDGPFFMLYLSRLSSDGWLGMIFFQDEHRWVRLQDVRWRPILDTRDQPTVDGILTFRHPMPDDNAAFAEYAADTTNLDSGRTDARLRGTVTVNGMERRWVAERVARVGVWKSTGGSPSFIAINRLEGDYDRWYARYIYGMAQWFPTGESVNWNGFDVTIAVQKIADIKSIEGTLAGDTLRATITLMGGGGGATIQWEGKRLPEDIPF